ncbi:hypothetical protein SEA_CASSIA_59 [Arthrobacter phage Cassia]|uniref:Uncharacterized protein n=1 Tax=Arthrobacter phage Cassia TaxID=2927275 RepID=A0AAF0GJ87_9CAUD|nr:hypothetical protein SEA_CASSIA_59 [Arthrobacter phage Cassia]
MAHVIYSNFSSGYAQAKCSECGWTGQRWIGAGKLSNDSARKEAAAHEAAHEAEKTKEGQELQAAATWWIGENEIPQGGWTADERLAFVDEFREGGQEGLVEEFRLALQGATCEHGLSSWLCAGPGHYPADHPF